MSGLLAVVWLALASPQDAACLGCHGDPSVVGGQGKHLLVDARRHSASVHGALECTACHDTIHEYPHPPKRSRVECVTCHADERADVDRSIHGAALGSDACQSCHGAPHDIAKLSDAGGHEARCASCHDSEVRDYKSSVHASALGHGDHTGATCRSCHGPSHGVRATSDPARRCPGCKIADTLRQLPRESRLPGTAQDSVRASGRGVQAERPRTRPGRGNEKAASCSDCHGSHAVLPGRDAASKINHWRVPETCGTCHSKIHDAYAGSVHGQAVASGVPGAPVCTDCHGEHDILAPERAGQPRQRRTRLDRDVRPLPWRRAARCPLQPAARQAAGLRGQFPRPGDEVGPADGRQLRVVSRGAHDPAVERPAFVGQSGQPREDLRSVPCRRRRTVHDREGSRALLDDERASRRSPRSARFYWVLIPLALGLMLLHNGLDWWRKLRERNGPHGDGRDAAADERALPHRARHDDGGFRGARRHWLRLEVPRVVVGVAAAPVGRPPRASRRRSPRGRGGAAARAGLPRRTSAGVAPRPKGPDVSAAGLAGRARCRGDDVAQPRRPQRRVPPSTCSRTTRRSSTGPTSGERS